MKLNLKTDEVLNVLSKVLPAASTRSTLPSLSHFLFEAKDDKLKIYATDLEIGIETTIPVDVEKEGTTTIPAKRLYNIVSVIDSETITLKKVNESTYKITDNDGKTTFNIKCSNADDFPKLPDLKSEKKAQIDSDLLMESINKVIVSVSKDESRYVLCGVYFESEGDSFNMVSTDGRKLSLYKNKLKEKGDNIKAVIPTNAVNILSKTLKDEDNEVSINLNISENQIDFRSGNTVVYSRLIEGDYPNYKQVIPEKTDKNITIDTADLLLATKKMMAVSQEVSHPVTYTFKNNKLILSSQSSDDIGSGSSSIDIEYKGKEIEIAFNPSFITNTLKVIKSEKIILGLTTSINPGKITAASGEENYIGVIMPMRP
ncbi:MAG: DNA polymerase III subunit beta [Elusimicrobia bacterium]|jgi:DNA polymerase-3 subunit beta|nr:DNA polymerase III subunit beta [Elusimicrobiota bacterium]